MKQEIPTFKVVLVGKSLKFKVSQLKYFKHLLLDKSSKTVRNL